MPKKEIYQQGLSDLVKVFGIKNLDVITEDNWRMFAKSRKNDWKEFRDREFQTLITKICKMARIYNFNVWVGGQGNPYSFIISAWIAQDIRMAVSVRMDPGKFYRYMATDTKEANPNRVSKKDYHLEIGNSVNEVEEYITQRVTEFVKKYGKPVGENYLFTKKKFDMHNVSEQIMKIYRSHDWDMESDHRNH